MQPSKAFWVLNLRILFFYKTLHHIKSESANFIHDNSYFQNCSPKIPKQGNFGPKLKLFYSQEALYFDKFESADFKYGNRFSNSCLKIRKNGYLVLTRKLLGAE